MGDAAAGARNRLLGVAGVVREVVAEDGEGIGWGTARGGEASAVGDVGGTTEEFLPPGPAIGVVGIRRGGLDAEGPEEGVEPAFVLVYLFGTETEEEEEDVGEEGEGPDVDGKLEGEDGACFEENGGDLVVAVEIEVGVVPRDPGGNGFVNGIGQELV